MEQKIPDLTLTFFLQTTDLKLKGPLFTETTKTTEVKSVYCNLQTGRNPPSIFSSLWDFFSSFLSPKGPLIDLTEVPLVISKVKRYIRTFDVILRFIEEEALVREQEFFMKTS